MMGAAGALPAVLLKKGVDSHAALGSKIILEGGGR